MSLLSPRQKHTAAAAALLESVKEKLWILLNVTWTRVEGWDRRRRQPEWNFLHEIQIVIISELTNWTLSFGARLIDHINELNNKKCGEIAESLNSK